VLFNDVQVNKVSVLFCYIEDSLWTVCVLPIYLMR